MFSHIVGEIEERPTGIEFDARKLALEQNRNKERRRRAKRILYSHVIRMDIFPTPFRCHDQHAKLGQIRFIAGILFHPVPQDDISHERILIIACLQCMLQHSNSILLEAVRTCRRIEVRPWNPPRGWVAVFPVTR